MADFLCSLGSMVPLLGPLMLLRVEAALGRYSSGLLAEWGPPDGFDAVEVASRMADAPDVWTDGSLVQDQVTGVFSSGAGFYAISPMIVGVGGLLRGVHLMSLMWFRLLLGCRITPMSGLMVALSWIGSRVSLLLELGFLLIKLMTAGVIGGGVMLLEFAPLVMFSPVGVSALFLGLSSLFRGLRCGVSFWRCSLLLLFIWELTTLVWFVMLVDRLIVSMVFLSLFELVNDGDLLLLLETVLHLRGLDTARVTKVKGHADEGMVLDGRVGELDRLGNDAADEAADFGRWRVGNAVIDARRNLSGVCGRWHPVLLDLHKFFIAISRAVVNHDGWDGTAPDPMIRSAHPQEASAGSCGSGPGFFAWATLYLGFGVGYCSCICSLR